MGRVPAPDDVFEGPWPEETVGGLDPFSEDGPVEDLDPTLEPDGLSGVDEDATVDDGDGLVYDMADEAVVLGWTTQVRVDGADVEAVLDPTRPHSSWSVPGGRGRKDVVIEVGGRNVPVSLEFADGSAGLVLGRDVLSGRVWVRC